MAAVVARWVRWYTSNLPPEVAERRIEELDADLHDHIAHERAAGISERRIAGSLAARLVRGLPADVSWRARMAPMSVARSARRVALLAALVLLVPLVAMQFTDGVAWSVADFVVAGVLLAGTGVLYELALRRPGTFVYRAIATVIGVAATRRGGRRRPGTRRVRLPGGPRHDRAGGEALPARRVAPTRYPKSSALGCARAVRVGDDVLRPRDPRSSAWRGVSQPGRVALALVRRFPG